MQLANKTPLINPRTIKDTGVKNVINALSNEIYKAQQMLGKVVIASSGQEVKSVGQKTVKTFAKTKKEAVPYARYIKNRSNFDAENFQGLASTLKVTEKNLFKLMEVDQVASDQIGSRVLAWQMVLDDMTAQFSKSLDAKDLTDPFVQTQAAEMIGTMNDLWNAFSEMPRSLGRALASRKIQMDKKYLKKNKDNKVIPKSDEELTPSDVLARNNFFRKQLQDRGMNPELLKTLRNAMGLESSNMLKNRALKQSLEASFQGRKALLEVYRGLLLANAKSLVTNFLGNTLETVMIPATRMIGHMATLNPKGVAKEIGFVSNMLLSMGKATKGALDSLINERNLLDPLRTKIDDVSGDTATTFYMQMEKANSSGYWHPLNWIPFLVNSGGKVARASLRVLGAQDEFFKVMIYNAKAMSKIAEVVPEGLSRAEKKNFIKRNLTMFYDSNGEAIDKDLIDYARRSVFQENLEEGFVKTIHEAISKNPELGMFLPFVRTPANLVSRAIQRTPVANFRSARTKRMWNSGNADERAEVIGNTIVGVGIYSTALGYASSGLITGSGPVDRQRKRLWKEAGFKPYHVKIGDTYYRYDRFEPLMLPFAYVSSLHENLYLYNNNQEELLDNIGIFLAVSAETLVDRTWLRGVKNMIDAFDVGTDSGSIGRGLTKFGSGFIPASINQAHRLLANENSGAYAFKEAITASEILMKKLNPMSPYDNIKYNWLTGEPMLLPSGSDLGLDRTRKKPSKYMEELLRFGNGISGVSKKLGTVDLTGEQYSRLTQLTGTIENADGYNLMDTIEELMDRPEYDFDENRVYHDDFISPQQKMVMRIINAYKEQARHELLLEDSDLREAWEKGELDKAKVGLGMELDE